MKYIVQENMRRLAKYNAPYDPIRGIGSHIERFPFPLSEGNVIFLPVTMKTEPLIVNALKAKALNSYIENNQMMGKSSNFPEVIVSEFFKMRLKHDFEFWSATCANITDKVTKLTSPFILRYPQRVLLKELEDMRTSGLPIRVVLLKARQWGGSTLVQMYMAWIQILHRENWHSAIVADVDDQARNIRAMFENMAKKHPPEVQKISWGSYQGSAKNKIMSERGCVVGIGSAQKPDNFRSFDFAMLHASEVGLWKTTDGKSPEDLMQALRGGVSDVPYSIIVLESTAKGVGTFFHKEWLNAVNKKSRYVPVFVPWFYITDLYSLPVKNYYKYIKGLSKREWELWQAGATLEGILWYSTFKANENYSDWRMASEYPTTAEEAFQSTGNRAFEPFYVTNARKNCIHPIATGDVKGASMTGVDSLREVVFNENPNGNMRIYSYPDKTENISNRYALFADVGGRHHKSDKSVVKVFDRYWQMQGGVPEVAAVWEGNIDQDLFAWKAAQIGVMYNNGLLAVEVNSLKKETKSSEGDHFLTVLDAISPYYPNLYMRMNPEKIVNGSPTLYGFHTNPATKPMIIDALNAALRDELYIERDFRSCDQMDTYEIKADGSYGAVAGSNDDLVICTAGGVWLCLSYMPNPALVVTKKPHQQIINSEAAF